MHPIMPFITESLWQTIKDYANIDAETIMLQPYPLADEALINSKAEQDVIWIQKIILAIRNVRGEVNIPPSKTLRVLLKNGTATDRERIDQFKVFIAELAKVESFEWIATDATVSDSATTLVDQLEILIPFAGLINKAEEAARLTKEITKLKTDLEKIETKLANPSFIEKAPKAVVDQEKQRAKELKEAMEKLALLI
jgi:valyl-tRNA synthetase